MPLSNLRLPSSKIVDGTNTNNFKETQIFATSLILDGQTLFNNQDFISQLTRVDTYYSDYKQHLNQKKKFYSLISHPFSNQSYLFQLISNQSKKTTKPYYKITTIGKLYSLNEMMITSNHDAYRKKVLKENYFLQFPIQALETIGINSSHVCGYHFEIGRLVKFVDYYIQISEVNEINIINENIEQIR